MSKLQFTRFRLHWLTLLSLFLALVFSLTAVSIWQSWQFQTRGIPPHLPDPIPAGGTQLGLNVALEQYNDAELATVLDELDALGLPYLKQSFYFPQEGAFDWAASDRLFTAVSAHPNLTLIPLLNGDPATQFAPPADKTAFAAWAGEFAQRYGAQTDVYIIWDEPNLTTQWGGQPVNAAEYAALLTAVSAQIRTADPDALIASAPLAPTTETGPQNLADHLYLQRLYEAGAQDAFDVVMGKPYGFDTGPDDRRVDPRVLNFSRLILLREVVARNEDGHTAVWAGNWGWNSLPPGWAGQPSVWGQTDPQTQVAHLVSGFHRARTEWPWAGVLFIEGWQANAPADAAQHGFDLRGNPHTAVLTTAHQETQQHAFSGFHLAAPDNPHQTYSGGWEFSPQFGADASEIAAGQAPDQVSFSFWGTEAGLRVRRADFRARLYITIDGQPANALPRAENGANGAVLVLTAADPTEDYLSTELVAENLAPGPHTMHIVVSRGWDQWALNGFSVQSRPNFAPYQLGMIMSISAALLCLLAAITAARRANWHDTGFAPAITALSDRAQLALTAVSAAVTALTGWLVWGDGLYRRLGDLSQLTLVAASAATFYITPWFWLYLVALLAFFVLVYFRPALALPIIAFSFPFYVPSVLKPVFQYQFSPVEVFTLTAVLALVASASLGWMRRRAAQPEATPLPRWRPNKTDTAVLLFVAVATLSLLFTQRLDVATNEWRVVIIGPALFYFLVRGSRPTPRELWHMLDGFVLGGLLIALIGLWQYGTGSNLIEAEGGLMRLRSIYGSPNNVALYLGRVLPLLAAVFLLGQPMSQRRRWAYTAVAVPVSLAILLSFSKGAILLGVPLALLVVFVVWQKSAGRRVWPWLVLFGVTAVVGYALILQIPQLAARLDPRSATGFFRVNLWQASLNMIRENPLFGVGLDNFLYAYRGRYIFDAAWQEPNLNHPHNLFLDLGTRLGLAGLISGLWLWGLAFWSLGRTVWQGLQAKTKGKGAFYPVAVGFLAALVHAVAHGLVDHSFFLVDLAFVFYLVLATAVWLENLTPEVQHAQ